MPQKISIRLRFGDNRTNSFFCNLKNDYLCSFNSFEFNSKFNFE